MPTVNLTINGQKITARRHHTVLEAAEAAGIHIPTLCHHPALEPIGACRVCLIEVSRQQPLYPACAYRVSEGLNVETNSERVLKARRFVLDMLFSERNHYCMYCEMSGNCELQNLGYEYGLDHWVYTTYQERFPVDATRDTFLMDHNRCVLCRRCVRACAELVGNHTLGMRQRGSKTMITADLNVPFGDSSCVSCGTCLQVCPTGALIDKRSAFMDMGRHAQVERVPSVCTGCSAGCGIQVVTRGGNIVRIEGDWDADPNHGVLCEKGRFRPFQDTRARITTPQVRLNGSLQPASWDEALEHAARGLASAAGKLGLLASTTVSNEALDQATRLSQDLGARCAAVLDGTAVLEGAVHALPVPHGTLDSIAAADLILVVGADPAVEQPVVSFLVKRRVDQGARLFVVSDVDNALAPFAHQNLHLAGIDVAVDAAGRADSPVVLYGPAITPAVATALAGLQAATFIALEPAVNSRGALARGFGAGAGMDGVEALYVLLGDEPWNGDRPLPADGTFLVVQASYASPLTDRADVVLPTAAWAERAGTFTNLEGRERKAQPAVAPAGEARMDWDIVSLVADRAASNR